MAEIDRYIGSLEARVKALEEDMSELRGDTKQILAILNQTKGSWKTLVMIGGCAGAVGAFLAKLIPLNNFLPK